MFALTWSRGCRGTALEIGCGDCGVGAGAPSKAYLRTIARFPLPPKVGLRFVNSDTARPVTVLVADDEPMIRRAIGRVLERAGHVVHHAEGAEQAVELLSRHRFQIALVDHHMPGGGGTVLDALARDADFEGVAVLMTGDDVEGEGLPGGPEVRRLQKPFRLDEVVALVASAARPAAEPIDPSDLLVRAGWLEAADHLLGGLTHDLNGRVTSLGGMAQLLALDEDARSMVPFLEEEVRRLEAAVRLLALMGGDGDPTPEPLPLNELSERLVELHRRYRGLEGVEVTLDRAGPCRVLAPWPLFGRALLLLMAHAGHEALLRSRRLDVVVRPGSGPGEVAVRLAAPGSRAEVARPTWRHPIEPLMGLFRRLGGVLRRESGPDRYQLALDLTARRPGGR